MVLDKRWSTKHSFKELLLLVPRHLRKQSLSSVPDLVQYHQVVYSQWESFYLCLFSTTVDFDSLEKDNVTSNWLVGSGAKDENLGTGKKIIFIPRCWIHMHPRWKAFMSSTDIYQLYNNALLEEGLKALSVHPTEAGFTEIKHFCENARALGVDMMEYALSCISTSDMKLYCQIPFDASSEPRVVIDQRSEREIIHQMRDFIVSGEADDSWISP